MTVIRPNAISGITSLTAQGDVINFFKSDGTLSGLEIGGARINATGISTFTSIKVGTAQTLDASGIDVTGVITATSFKGDGSTLTGVAATSNIKTNAIVNSGVTTTATLSVTGVGTFGTSVGVLTANPRATVQVGSATSQSVFITSDGLVGLASTAPRVSLDASQETDAIALPQGTTAQRPSGNSPYIRYNTTNSALEFYNGTDWVEIISDYFPTGSVILG